MTAKKVSYSRKGAGDSESEVRPDLLSWTADLRRRYQRLRNASFVSELNSELFRLNRIVDRHQAGRPLEQSNLDETYSRKHHLEELLKQLNSEADAIMETEEALLLHSANQGEAPPELVAPSDYEQLLVALYAATQRPPHSVTLVFLAERSSLIFDLAIDYFEAAKEFGNRVEVGVFPKKPDLELLSEDKKKALPEIVQNDEMYELAEEKPERFGAIALKIEGPLAWLRFRGEHGGHEFQSPGEDPGSKKKRRERVLIRVFEQKLDETWIAVDELNRPDVKSEPTNRSYNVNEYSPKGLKERLMNALIEEAERGL